MPSKFIHIKGFAYNVRDGKYFPNAICQRCNKVITEYHNGLIMDNDNEGIIVHKTCQNLPEDLHEYSSSMELCVFVTMLGVNIGIDNDKRRNEQMRLAGLISSLG